MPELALVFALPLAILAVGATAALGGLVALQADGSPFVKILSDASALFRRDVRLWLIPLFLLGFFLALSASFLVFWPLMLAQLLVWSGAPATQAETLMIGTMWACLIASTVAGAMVVTVADSVLAEAFVEESRGERGGFVRSAWAVVRRLPALIAFGFLWGLTLAVGTVVRMAFQDGALRFGGWAVGIPVLVAGWALELGFTMASYFMFLMIVREGLGPLQALDRAAELARADFGGNLAELFAIKALDGGIMAVSMGLFVVVFTGGMFSGIGDPGATSDPYLLWKVSGAAIGAAVLVPVVYFVALQTLQILVAAASYLYARDGVVIRGFAAEDFDRVIGLRPGSLRAVGLGAAVSATSTNPE